MRIIHITSKYTFIADIDALDHFAFIMATAAVNLRLAPQNTAGILNF